MTRIIIPIIAITVLLSAIPTRADDVEVGVGSQLLFVDGTRGVERVVGIDLRAAFWQVFGVYGLAAAFDSAESGWRSSDCRLGVVLHMSTGDWWDIYLSPGLAANELGDLFNPFGETTWVRVGGGAELRISDLFAINFEVHLAIPSNQVIHDYVEANNDVLLERYEAALTSEQELPPTALEIPEGDLADLIDLDRFEYAVGLRHYF